jgi:hypothetical protein
MTNLFSRAFARPWRRLSLVILSGFMLSLALPFQAAAQFKDDADPAEESGDHEDLGLVSEREYESPQHGYSVEWSRDWVVDPYSDEPVTSDLASRQDGLVLAWADGSMETFASIYGTSRGLAVDEQVADWIEPDRVAATWGGQFDVTVLLDDTGRKAGAVLYALDEAGTNEPVRLIMLYVVVELPDGTTLYLTLLGTPDVFEAMYDVAARILVNGEPVFGYFEPADIAGAISDAA